MAVQVDPMKPECISLELVSLNTVINCSHVLSYDKLLSCFACKFNMRRYIPGDVAGRLPNSWDFQEKVVDDPLGLTPLHVAAKLGFVEIVRALTKVGAWRVIQCCSPRLPTHFEPWSLELHGTL